MLHYYSSRQERYINKKHWDSAYLCQGTSCQCRDPESLPKFRHFFTGELLAFPENFMQIRLEVFFAQSC